MKNMSFVDSVIKNTSKPIHLVRCSDHAGRPCYFFMMGAEYKIKALQSRISKGSLDLRDYGTIIASGFGKDPSQEVIKMLKEKYDFDYNES